MEGKTCGSKRLGHEGLKVTATLEGCGHREDFIGSSTESGAARVLCRFGLTYLILTMLREQFRIGWRWGTASGEALLKKDNLLYQHLSTVFCHVEHFGQGGLAD